MSELLVISFANEEKAEQGGRKLLSMEKQDLITIEDAVIALKKTDGAVKLKQLSGRSEFWEIRAAASGYPAPMLGGALTEFGGNDKFVKDLAEAIPAGGAAIIVLARKVKADDLFAGLSAADGTVFSYRL